MEGSYIVIAFEIASRDILDVFKIELKGYNKNSYEAFSSFAARRYAVAKSKIAKIHLRDTKSIVNGDFPADNEISLISDLNKCLQRRYDEFDRIMWWVNECSFDECIKELEIETNVKYIEEF